MRLEKVLQKEQDNSIYTNTNANQFNVGVCLY
jgi:hypothetical protein